MLIVTPNPAVDHTIRVQSMRLGEVIRTRPGISVAGGKGANVARAAHCLGVASTVLLLVPQLGAAHLLELFEQEGLNVLPVPVEGRVRTCTAMIEDDGRVTLLNEPGPAVSDGDWARLLSALQAHLAVTDHQGPVLCSGSLPPGAPVDGYAQVVDAGHRAGLEVLVDAGGNALAAAIRAGADLVCPNVSEAEELLGTGDGVESMSDDGADVPARAQAAAAGLVAKGAQWAVVTAGAAGAAVAGPGFGAWHRSPTVTVRNPIGAGDSFLAGLATARLAGRDWPSAIRRGLASGSASVEQDAAGVVDPARVDELEQLIGAA